MTSPQHTDRSGTDEIPGPRGGQGVRLLVLGNDTDAQQLRDRALAAGYELAQRYSARVSHVAYGSGIDPEDVRYAKIRDAGLPLLPLQACASELGLRSGAARAGKTGKTGKAGERPAEAVETAETAEAVKTAAAAEATVVVEAAQPRETAEAEPEIDRERETEAEPEPVSEAPVFPPLAAAVIGVDPWEGDQQAAKYVFRETAPESEATAESELETEAEAETQAEPEAAAEPQAATEPASASAPVVWTGSVATSRSSLGRIVTSILWALIPFATFGLLSPITFGYAAYRLRSRGLALTTLAYTLAVMLAFVLSAIRPHASAPSDVAGALLTVCLAGTWVGGTLHAFSLRTRVFAR